MASEPKTGSRAEQGILFGGAYRSGIIVRLRDDPRAIGKLLKEGKYP